MPKIVKYWFSFLLTLALISTLSGNNALAICADTCSKVPAQYRCNSPACKDCPECLPQKQEGFFGTITIPQGIVKYGDLEKGGLIKFANNLLKLLIVGAGLFVFFNIISAGYNFISSGGEPKKIEQAWNKIWHSLVGLLLVAGSFILAAILGWIIFGDASAILSPKIYGP